MKLPPTIILTWLLVVGFAIFTTVYCAVHL